MKCDKQIEKHTLGKIDVKVEIQDLNQHEMPTILTSFRTSFSSYVFRVAMYSKIPHLFL